MDKVARRVLEVFGLAAITACMACGTAREPSATTTRDGGARPADQQARSRDSDAIAVDSVSLAHDSGVDQPVGTAGWHGGTCFPNGTCMEGLQCMAGAGGAKVCCSEPCTPDKKRCTALGDVERCVRAANGCPSFAPPEPCPSQRPYCLGDGECGSNCESECNKGAYRCGSAGLSSCGQHDGDECLEWGPAQRCTAGTRCDELRGACIDESQLSWRDNRAKTSDVFSKVWGTSASDVWTLSSYLRHYDGKSWTNVTMPFAGSPYGIWGSGPNDIWLCGGQSITPAAAHYDGTKWTRVDLKLKYTCTSMWGSGKNDVWAFGSAEQISHYDGKTWTKIPFDASHWLVKPDRPGFGLNAWGRATNDIWAFASGGDRAWVYHYDGNKWTTVTDLRSIGANGYGHLDDIWGAGKHVWIVGHATRGEKGFLAHYDGKTWTRDETFAKRIPRLRSVWASAPDDLWILGDRSYIDNGTLKSRNIVTYHFDGKAWSETDLGTRLGPLSMWGSSPADIWVVGWDGLRLHYN